jgi:hypothetical protein
VMAGITIDLDGIAMPQIFDPRHVEGLHSGLRSWNVLSALAGFVNGDDEVTTSAARSGHVSRS